MRIVVELKRGEESQLILNNLFKHTQMQESFGMILLSIVGGQPRELGLIPLIKLFIEHRMEVVRRRTIFELRKAEEREHILVGYQIALDHLDNVIRVIRGSGSRAEAKENLFKYFSEQEVTITENGKSKKLEGVKLDGRKYRFVGAAEIEAAGRGNSLTLSYAQIDAILELQLHRLTQLSIDEILKELKSIRDLIAELREILASDKKLKAVITGELREVHKAYGDDRRTQIVDKVDEIKLEDLIADTDQLITVSHAGYIKRPPRRIATNRAAAKAASAPGPRKRTSSSISSLPRPIATFCSSLPRAASTG
jgi:DNA gyrase subunit A